MTSISRLFIEDRFDFVSARCEFVALLTTSWANFDAEDDALDELDAEANEAFTPAEMDPTTVPYDAVTFKPKSRDD